MIVIFALIFVVPKAIYPLVSAKNKNVKIWIFAAISAFIIGGISAFGVLQILELLIGHFYRLPINFSGYLLYFVLFGSFIDVGIIRKILIKSFENK